VQLLTSFASQMDPVVVLSLLPGDVPLQSVAPYLTHSFQQLELRTQLAEMEAAAARSIVSDATCQQVALQQRCFWLDAHRHCVVCRQPLDDGGLVVIFPNLKPSHFRCFREGTLDPERGVPFADLP